MRPQTAQLNRTVLFNQLSGQYYTLGDKGKQIKTNKRGDIATKYVNDLTGFINFKERKVKAQMDKALMYNEPKLDYDKENGFICPKGNKFIGYAQSPYNLRGQNCQFLGGSSFKQTIISKGQSKSVKTQSRNGSKNVNNSSIEQQRSLNKFKQLKMFRKTNGIELNFELIKQKGVDNRSEDEWNGRNSRKSKNNKNAPSKGQRLQRSIIMRGVQKYNWMSNSTKNKGIRSNNTSSAPSLHRNTTKPHSTIHEDRTYFERSLWNIQRTQTPNYVCGEMSNGLEMSNKGEMNTNNNSFNKSSISSKCYKSSCHYVQYKPKRRYMIKDAGDNSVVNISQYRTKLQGEMKQKQLLYRLREQLKAYECSGEGGDGDGEGEKQEEVMRDEKAKKGVK